jgi:hypothetical protein
MEQNTTLDVWNEIRVTGDGISVSLYSEDETGAVVEDEVRLPFEDLQDEMTGDILSLGLSDSTKENLSNDGLVTNTSSDGQSDNVSELGPDVGDIVMDSESENFSSGRVRVTEVTDTPCSEHTIEKINGRETTVADENIGHPRDAPVVMGEYVDGSSKEYAFPLTRLEPVS